MPISGRGDADWPDLEELLGGKGKVAGGLEKAFEKCVFYGKLMVI